MTSSFDMQELRYLNLFESITKVNTRYFFRYNNMLVFCVPRMLIAKALGEIWKVPIIFPDEKYYPLAQGEKLPTFFIRLVNLSDKRIKELPNEFRTKFDIIVER